MPVRQVLGYTTSVMAKVVADRRDAGVEPYPSAIVFPHDGWWFAVIQYGGKRGDLVFHLDLLEADAVPVLKDARAAA
jgi:hypothetical protein